MVVIVHFAGQRTKFIQPYIETKKDLFFHYEKLLLQRIPMHESIKKIISDLQQTYNNKLSSWLTKQLRVDPLHGVKNASLHFCNDPRNTKKKWFNYNNGYEPWYLLYFHILQYNHVHVKKSSKVKYNMLRRLFIQVNYKKKTSRVPTKLEKIFSTEEKCTSKTIVRSTAYNM